MMTEADSIRIEELEQDNRRLRRLLDGRDAPGELRHRLRSTVALLTAIIQHSARTPRDLASYAAHLEDRLDAIARAQALADQFGQVDLQTLIADELLKYGALEGERLSLHGPTIALSPRAGQVFALAIHELAVNAVEHGGLGAADGRLEVAWTAADAGATLPLCLTWTETGRPISDGLSQQGFGTEVLTKMLPYECEAETQITLGTYGLCCTMHFSKAGLAGR